MNKINNINKLKKVIFLMGPTASGKTKFAISLCQNLPLEVISVDSALIYRGMDIGTAKPSIEELKLVPHHLLDICDPSEIYSVAKFHDDALKEITNITCRGKIPLLVGGTMLYFKVLLQGLSPLPCSNIEVRERIKQMYVGKNLYNLHDYLYKIDPPSANRIHYNDSQRILRALEVFFITGKTLTELVNHPRKGIPFNVYQFCIFPIDRNILYENIVLRYKKMLELGFEEEVRCLFKRNDLHKDLPSMRCVGYRQMWSYISGDIDYNDMIRQGICATWQLAKHQITWLRKWQNLHFLDINNQDSSLKKLVEVVNYE